MAEPDLDRIATEARNPRTTDLDALSPEALVDLIQQEDRAVFDAVRAAREPIARLVEAVAQRMERGGRLIYTGAGTSGRLGVLDAVECVPTFSAADGQVVGLIAGGERAFVRAVEGAEDSEAQGAADLEALALRAEDSVVGIAASGRTPYVVGGLEFAGARGALTGAVVCSPDAPVGRAAEIAVELATGPEVLTGSTRLKAGTATKMVLNTLSTGVFVRLGKCYGNLMVDVQPTNEKLVARSRRIVAAATGADGDAAGRLLADCGGEVKTAIVAGVADVGPDVARERLRAAGGRVRAALAMNDA